MKTEGEDQKPEKLKNKLAKPRRCVKAGFKAWARKSLGLASSSSPPCKKKKKKKRKLTAGSEREVLLHS